jgi:hypothetical protein
MGFAAITIFMILLYVPAFKSGVRRLTGAASAQARSLLGRRA